MQSKTAWVPLDKSKFIAAYMAGLTNDELGKMFEASSDKVEKYLRVLRNDKEVPLRGQFVPSEEIPTEVVDNNGMDLVLLKRLKSSPGALSILDLANELDMSPKRVEEIVARLKANNYLIGTEGGEIKSSVPSTRGKSEHYFNYVNGNRIKFGVVADTHLCSKYYRADILNALYDIFEEEGVQVVYHCGNWIDGEARFNKQDIHVHGLGNQVKWFVENYPQREGITTYFVAGDDHEGWYVQREGIDIGSYMQDVARKHGREDLQYLGYMEHDVYIPAKNKGCYTRIRVMHPGGGSAYALSYTPQKIVESLSGGDKPHILLLGHYHKSGSFFIRNIHTLQACCTENQTPFMRKKRLAAHLGGYICDVIQGDDGSVLSFLPNLIPFYDTAGSLDSWQYEM